MNTWLTTSLVMTASLFGYHQASAQESTLADQITLTNQYLTRMHAYGAFDGAILIAKGDQILLENGWGLSNREAQTRWNSSTISTVGSISKQFTGAALTLLAQQGKIDFQNTLADYFPSVPQDKADITIYQLLTHSAGFPGAIGSDLQYINRDDYLQLAWNTPLLFTPGDQYEYSNTGYSIAAAILEVVTNTTYKNFLHANLFGPAGMSDTGFPSEFNDNKRLAVGYRGTERWGTVQENISTETMTWHLTGNGGIHSTPRDMHLWWLAIRNNTILNPEFTDIYLAPYQDEGSGDSYYAYGWVNFQTPNGDRMLSHNGGNTFFFADCAFYPESDIFIYTATNDNHSLGVDTLDLLMSFGGSQLSLPPDPTNVDLHELEKLTLERARAYVEALNSGPDAYVQYSIDHRTDQGHDELLNDTRHKQAAGLREQFGRLEILDENLLSPFQCEIRVSAASSGDVMSIRVTLDAEPPYLVASIDLRAGQGDSDGE